MSRLKTFGWFILEFLGITVLAVIVLTFLLFLCWAHDHSSDRQKDLIMMQQMNQQ